MPASDVVLGGGRESRATTTEKIRVGCSTISFAKFCELLTLLGDDGEPRDWLWRPGFMLLLRASTGTLLTSHDFATNVRCGARVCVPSTRTEQRERRRRRKIGGPSRFKRLSLSPLASNHNPNARHGLHAPPLGSAAPRPRAAPAPHATRRRGEAVRRERHQFFARVLRRWGRGARVLRWR
jgi:hypothetical protein